MDVSDKDILQEIREAIRYNNTVDLKQALKKIKHVKSLNEIRCSLVSTAGKGKLDVVSILLTHGIDVNSRNRDLQTALMKTSERGRLDIVKLLLEYKADVNLIDKNKKSALCYSVENGKVEIVKMLVDNGADVNYTSFTTPLHESCKRGCFELVNILVEAGADVNKIDNSGDFPLCRSACNGNLDIVKLLVKNGADVNGGLSPPLFYSCDDGYFEITKYLVDAGADVNVTNSVGESALCRAATKGHFDTVELLLERGADVNNTISRNGETALLCAAGGGHPKIVELLLQYGADVNMVDGERNNALGFALNCENVIIAAMLIHNESRTYDFNTCYVRSAYSSINQTDKFGRTTLMLAAMKCCYKIVNDMKKHSDLSVFDVDGNTAFMLAAKNGHLDIVELLYDGTVQVNFKGQNALMLAAIGGHATVVEWLIYKGFDVNKTDQHGNTALMVAGKPEVVDVLLKHRADVNVMNCDGRNALMELLSKHEFGLLTAGHHPHCISNVIVTDAVSSMISAYSLKNSQQTIIECLLQLTYNLNARDNNGETAIIKVLKNSIDVNLINLILNQHPDVNVPDNDGNTPLMIAVQTHSVEITTRILSCTHDVNYKNNLGKTALMFAVGRQSLECVKLLLATSHIKVNDVDNDGNSALMLVLIVKILYIDCVSSIIADLLRHGADVNHVNNNKTSVLMLAVQKGFIPAGIYRDIDMGDSEGKTALMYAVERWVNERVVPQLLQQHKANVNVVDNTGETALMKAVKVDYWYNVELVKILLEYKADVYIQDKQGRTALMWAVTHRYTALDLTKLILESTSSDQATDQVRGQVLALDQTDFNERTALMLAARFFNVDVVKYLLDRGVSDSQLDAATKTLFINILKQGDIHHRYIVFNLTVSGISCVVTDCKKNPFAYLLPKINGKIHFDLADKDRNSLLILHARHQKEKIYEFKPKLLFNVKQDINAVNKYNKSALMIALENNNREFIKNICKLYEEADVVCPKGRTLLMMAAKAGVVNTVKYLVTNGSNVNQVDKKHRTALMYVVHCKPEHYHHKHSTFELIECLLFQDADVNVCDYKHENVLIKLLKHKVDEFLLQIVKHLLDYNAQINVMDRDGRSPLMIAIIQLSLINQRQNNGSMDKDIQLLIKQFNHVVHILLEKTDDVNTTDNQGNTALMLASKYGFNYMVQRLIKKTDDINRVNKKGQTAYDLALKNAHYSIVQTLVESKANVNTNDVLEFIAVFSGLHNLHQRSICLNKATRDVELWTAFLLELEKHSALATNRGENTPSHIYTSGLNKCKRYKGPNHVQDSNSRIMNFKDLLNKMYEPGAEIICDVLNRTREHFKDDCISVSSLLRMLFLDIVRHGKLEEHVSVYADTLTDLFNKAQTMHSTTQSFTLMTILSIVEFYIKSNLAFAECVARTRIVTIIIKATKEFLNCEVILLHHFVKRMLNVLAKLSIHLEGDEIETVLQAVEYLPATHDINDQISVKKIKILLRDNKEIITLKTDEIQLVVNELKEACVYQREEKFKSLLLDLTLFCVNDNNVSLICSCIPLKCLRYAHVTMKNELIKLISKLMSNNEFAQKLAGDERLMGKKGFDKSLQKEIKKKSRECFINRKINEEKMNKSQSSNSGDGSISSSRTVVISMENTDFPVKVSKHRDNIELIKVDKTEGRKRNQEQTAESGSSSASDSRRTVNWSIEEKSDLLVMVNEHRDIIESKKRDKTTRARRQEAWENIESQFKSHHPKFTHLKTKGIIEQYQRLKSQVKKQLTQLDVSTVSGETSIDKSIVKLMCEICQEEFKEVMPIYQHNEEMTSVEHDNGDNNIAENENNEEDYIDVTEHQEDFEVKALKKAEEDEMEVMEHENDSSEQHIYREENNLDTHFSPIDTNYISALPSLTPYYSTSPVRFQSLQMPEQTTSNYHVQENVQTYSRSVLETTIQEEITTHPSINDFQVNNINEQTDFVSQELSTSRQNVKPRTGVSSACIERKIMPYNRLQATKRKLEQGVLQLKREKQQEELKLAREKQAEEMRMVREKHEIEMEMLRLKKQCLERHLQQPGNTSGIFTSTQNVLDGDGASYLSLQ